MSAAEAMYTCRIASNNESLELELGYILKYVPFGRLCDLGIVIQAHSAKSQKIVSPNSKMKRSISSKTREFPKLMSSVEAAAVVLFIVLVYTVFLMGGLDSLLRSIVQLKDSQKVWSSEGGLWDHPEPNYRVLPFVAEFFASITAIPLAGGFLLYQALRFSYNGPVLILFLMDCWMYTCAFFSHMLLWPLLNSVTLTSVLTNALYTFGVYSGLAGGPFKKWYWRVPLTLALWSLVVYFVVILPPWFGENGGVPALLTIQTPAVISALAGAVYCRSRTQNPTGRRAFKFLTVSGVLLCSAMAVSLVEVTYGQYYQARYFGIVPVFHIIIHVLEQVGIYLYGVGVSAVEHCMVRPVAFGYPRLEYVWGCVPYYAITVREESQSLSPVRDERSSSEENEGVRRSARLRK